VEKKVIKYKKKQQLTDILFKHFYLKLERYTYNCTYFPFVLLSLLIADINFKFKHLGFCNLLLIK
jgi:hypothetical protein